jgi:hypothetical protein
MDEGDAMKLGDLNLGALVRLTAAGVVIFGIWGVVMALAMGWAERTWPSDDRRRVTEAELRPARANFRPVEGELPPAARGLHLRARLLELCRELGDGLIRRRSALASR